MAIETPDDLDRRRAGWWLVAALLAGVVAWFVLSFVGTFVLGLFVYYGARPVNRRLQAKFHFDGVAATLTLLFLVVPVLALLGYTGFVALSELSAVAGGDAARLVAERLPGNYRSVAGVLQHPHQFLNQLGNLSDLQQGVDTVVKTLGAITTGLLHLTLALAFAFFLFRDGDRLQAWYRTEVGGRDTAAYSYLAGVDADLEVVYVGSVLTVLAVTVGAVVFYNAYNVVAPSAVSLPFPTLLAVLTGLATFVPLVVGKLVYVPASAYLGWRAVASDPGLLVYPVAFLVVTFLFLDLLPQSVVQPYISGQSMHEGAVLFAYVLGAAMFGWYGLFLGPLLLVLVVQFANVVLGDLLRGGPFTPEPTGATTLGTDPAAAHVEAGGELPSEDRDAATNGTSFGAAAGANGASDGDAAADVGDPADEDADDADCPD